MLSNSHVESSQQGKTAYICKDSTHPRLGLTYDQMAMFKIAVGKIFLHNKEIEGGTKYHDCGTVVQNFTTEPDQRP